MIISDIENEKNIINSEINLFNLTPREIEKDSLSI